MVTLLVALQIWCLLKVRTPSGWPKSDFGNFFLSFSLKAHNYYPAYHIGPDFSNRKRFIIQCYNLLCNGSACFDRRGYWMSANSLAKLWKTAEFNISLNKAKKNKFCLRSVYCLPETWWEKVCLKGWFTRHQIRRQDLLVN